MSSDNASSHVAQNLDSSSYTLSLFYVKGASSFSASGSLGTNNQPGLSSGTSFGGITTVATTGNSDTISVAWIQRWVPKIFDTHLNYDFANNHSESPQVPSLTAPYSTLLDSIRSTYSLGCNYTLKEVHSFGLTLSYAMVNSTTETFTPPLPPTVTVKDQVGELLADATYNYKF